MFCRKKNNKLLPKVENAFTNKFYKSKKYFYK
jgi:hypothetical protein